MKILMLTTHLNTGGISSYLFTLSRALIAQGHQVHIISSGGNMVDRFKGSGVIIKEMNIKTKSELSWRIYFSLNKIGKYIKEQRIDVIHAHTRVTQVIAAWIHLIYGTKYVTTCHGFFKPKFFRHVFSCWGNAVIAISKQVQDHLHKDFHVKNEKIHLIESGIDADDFRLIDKNTRRENRKYLGFADDDLVVGMVARLSDVKGQDILLKAFPKVVQQFPKARLVLVGQGKEEEYLKLLKRQLNLQQSVRFYTHLDQTAFFLSTFDVFVNPSRQEGLGLSVMEAQASGLAVIASNVGGIPTLITHDKTGYLFQSENIEALSAQLIDVLSRPQEREWIGANAREFICQNYSAQKMSEKTVNVYQKVLNG